MHTQKPFAGAGLNTVNGITSSRLLHLGKKELLVFYQQAAKRRMFVSECADVVGIDYRYDARHLHDDVIERHLTVERLTSTPCAIVSDHTGFDSTAAPQFDDARDDAAMWE